MTRPALLLAALALGGAAAAQETPKALSLERAQRTARERQPQIRQAQASTAAAQARVDEARSGLLPQVSAGANYQRGTSNFAARPGSVPSSLGGVGNASWDTANYFSFNATASQLVWDFGRTLGQYRSAQAGAEAQQLSEKTAGQQVLLNVTAAFFNARATKALVTVARESLGNQAKHLEQVQGFVDVGTRPQIDLAQARTAVANSRVQLVNAENNYETAKARLNQAMGVEGPTDYDVADDSLPAVNGEDLATDPLVEEAVKARPEIASLQSQLRAQELTGQALRGNYWPSLGVSTGFTDAGNKLDGLVWNWNAQATINWALYSGGLTRAQEQEAEANLRSLQAQADALRQSVRLEVEQARLAVRAAKETLASTLEALTNAQEQLRLAEGRYQTGLGNALELSDAQLALTNAQSQRVQADFNLASARAQLLKALGRL
jgi:outer membrane protein